MQSEFEKRARAMADGDEEPLTENEKHALRNSTVTDDGRHVCGKTNTKRRVETDTVDSLGSWGKFRYSSQNQVPAAGLW